MKLEEVALKLSCRLEGDGNVEITGVATLEDARAGELSFLTNMKYYGEAKATSASALIVGEDCPSLDLPLLKHKNPYLTFAKAVELFYLSPPPEPYIHPTAWVSDTAVLGKGVSLGAYTYVGEQVLIEDYVTIGPHCVIHKGVTIGEKSLIHSGCAVREYVRVGKRCIIQNNAVLGSDGFGYAKEDDGSWYKIYQSGTVVLEDDVEVGACTTIDRATIGETVIRKGTKIDNQVQVGHGSAIDANSLICAQVGLAGSTKVGKGVILAGQVGSAGHLKIGDGVIATGQTGIPGSVEPGKVISGSPAIENKNWLKSTAIFSRLPELQKTLRDMEKRLTRLENTFKVMPEVTA
jgi:UDP-3-O-[3-hydroxymyristoyl] glucosamine N-acyltransferase